MNPLKNLYTGLRQKALNGLIISSPANISYVVGFRSRDSYSLISEKRNIYFTDSRYVEEVAKSLQSPFELEKTDGSVFKIIARSCLDLGLKSIGFEERHLPYAEYKSIKQHLGKGLDLIPVHNLIEDLRQIKSPGELKKIRRSAGIAVSALRYIKRRLSPGQKEVEIAAELEHFIRYHGAVKSAFEIIVAAGPNSAFAHHIPSQRRLRKDDIVLIDIGVDCCGYKSDLTRVFFLGKINVLAAKVYDIVCRAQEQAIKKIRPGCKISEIDKAARNYIIQQGFGVCFTHNSGHGVGLEVHEAPQISSREDGKLEPGMVFTVEPAIYLLKRFGVRVEDMVAVTAKGCKVISGALNK